MRHRGFTLAELLIALAILGVIATFTIPKVLQSQQDSKKKSIAKEAAAIISEAYQAYKMKNGSPPTNMYPNALTPYINYVKIVTTPVDEVNTMGSVNCNSDVCILLHNGGVMSFDMGTNFGGNTANNFVWLRIDPDGTYSGSTTGSGKGLSFFLYYDGRLGTWSSVKSGATNSGYAPGSLSNQPTYDPSWFNWD